MKKLILVVLLFLFSLSAVAGDNSGKTLVFLTTPAQLAGTQLAPGEYKMQWTGDANSVKVTFMSGGQEVASASGKFVQRDKAPAKSAVVKGEGGQIKQVWFAGKKTAIVFE